MPFRIELPAGIEILGPLGRTRGTVTAVTAESDGIRLEIDGLPDVKLPL